MRKVRFSYIALIFILCNGLLVSSLMAQDLIWVTVEGKAPIVNISVEEARSRAIEDAERQAIEEAIGMDISAETLIVNLRLSGSILGAIPHGRVIKKQILEEGEREIPKKGQETPPPLYWVKMKAGVGEEDTGIDHSFSLEASLNHSNFKEGDEMAIRLKPTKDCYCSVFNILEDEKVLRLIPNLFKQDNFLPANKTFFFPDDNDKGKGISLRAHVPEDKDTVTESIYVVALKQPLGLGTLKMEEGVFGLYDGQTVFMKELIREIIGIPLSERAEQFIQYTISR